MRTPVQAGGSPETRIETVGDPLEGQFDTIARLLYETSGIALNESKRQLVHSRLTRRIRQLGGGTLRDYVAFVQTPKGREELTEMVDLLTTNKTSFFRESVHFDFLRGLLESRPSGSPRMTIWSAGCSSGEEPYSIAMVLAEHGARGSPGRILATDLSERVLERARRGIYGEDQVAEVPGPLRDRYLAAGVESGTCKVDPALRRMVRFGRLNLMGSWPMKGPFDVIFCRNVMIYFDPPTRERLVNRMAGLLAPGGHLFVGHSESLSSLSHPLQYVQPATYRR
ncbi:MAG: methyltransferase domain-containing protein [Gemmatimonadales bacterium]|nr:MAG: methyltransferase domain-containing protein [Gemmatimonadales bacterium]